MKVATYTRISTDEEHQPYSLEVQDQRLAAYVASQDGWDLCRRYSDRMTGSTLERPELQRALADARVRRYDLLLVYRVDRLSRSVRGLAQILCRPIACRSRRFALCQEWWTQTYGSRTARAGRPDR